MLNVILFCLYCYGLFRLGRFAFRAIKRWIK